MVAANDPPGGSPLTVVVSGDVTMDWNLAQQPLSDAADGPQGDVATRPSWQRGGAALLADLLETVAVRGLHDADIRPMDAPRSPIPPGDDRLNHSYALWSRVPRDGDGPLEDVVWRVASFLGVDGSRNADVVQEEWARLHRDVPDADVVVLDDAALGFRGHSDRGLWRHAMTAGRRPWVLLKVSKPVADGPLWEHLLAECAERLVVVMTIDDLRGTEVQVSRELSWERTAQDLFWELVHQPRVNALSLAAHTVVSFGPAGAVLLSRAATGRPGCSLLFDPERIEGMWETQFTGRMMGFTTCLLAAIFREFLLDPVAPAVAAGIQAGIAAARRLHLDGYEERGQGRMELGFPLTRIASEIAAADRPLEHVDVPDPARHVAGEEDEIAYWTILHDRGRGDLTDLAADIAVRGPEAALRGVPLGRFGALVTADRSEIEAYRSVRALVAEYVRTPRTTPLSIGVFGPPGAGKSFGLVQVVRSVVPTLIGAPLEFNLSQFAGPHELIDAFHRVRDVGLAGSLPLVFWDEFDTPLEGETLGWLRYFLAPMQDGTFRQGQVVHPIGRSIFVFAGGTSERIGDFVDRADAEVFRQAKGPDFVSRLKGHVNVLGPNPRRETDPYFVVRRAILLRSILRRLAPHLFDGETLRIDRGVLRAFLETTTYRHGARSLEAILSMSLLAGRTTYERSSLPAEPQLHVHVDARDFVALVQRIDVEGDLLERLAAAAHEVRAARAGGAATTYAKLGGGEQERCRDDVRDIPDMLDRVGCVMLPARSDLPRFAFTPEEIETLARDEHDRVIEGDGVVGGETGGRHAAWDDLSEAARDVVRDRVRDIPTLLARAGYAVVRRDESE